MNSQFSGCGGNFSGPSGFLTSPSYPNSYPNNIECIYLVTQPIGTLINIEIISIDIDCEYYGTSSDLLKIRDGPSESSPLINTLCGNEDSSPKFMQTSQNNLRMR